MNKIVTSIRNSFSSFLYIKSGYPIIRAKVAAIQVIRNTLISVAPRNPTVSSIHPAATKLATATDRPTIATMDLS